MFSRDEHGMLSVDDDKSDEDTRAAPKGKGKQATGAKRKAVRSPPQSPSKASSPKKTKKVRKNMSNNADEDHANSTKGKGKGKATNDDMDVDPAPSTTATGTSKSKGKPETKVKPKVVPPPTPTPPVPDTSTHAEPLHPVPSGSTTAAPTLTAAFVSNPPRLEDPTMAAATLDPNYWKDPYEIEAEINLTFDSDKEPPLSPLFSKSPTPEPTTQLVPPPARKAVRNSSTNSNSLEFGPSHPMTFSAGTRGARGARGACGARGARFVRRAHRG
ncbi:hypothetical protein JVT61DRAFT_6135 [Boletus reticuloceps]|uniref:Uncharacterized protein n=1 Tax=Boletus reticuloceps TaxID=495285 RepID=A0A8I2YKF7_9AGAM|nr:hypothetical protein JVT61DRAFT_6135 [Boletus reticuloceps]